MYNRFFRLITLLLLAALLLSGCGMDLWGYLDDTFGYHDPVAYRDMEYTRPDMAELENTLTTAQHVAQNAGYLGEVTAAIGDFYNLYDRFVTSYFLADIHYSADLTDTYWETEYNFCSDAMPTLDAALEELYYTLADSPFRAELEKQGYFSEGFFDAYDGENIWDTRFLALLEQEAKLVSQYYDLSDEALSTEIYSEEYFTAFTEPLTQLLVKLVGVRQEIAAYAGFSSYAEYAYTYNFARDYTPAQTLDYISQVGESMYDVYCRTNQTDVLNLATSYCSEEDTFQYVSEASKAMGGTVKEAFSVLSSCGLYDISYGENKYDSSFEVYLWSYHSPFVFLSPRLDQSDKLTFAHEFGHFANDYACGGSYAGIDIAEVHSQAFEYLSLCYTQDSATLTKWKMADSLCTFVECAAYALFEHKLYELTGEDLTAENVMELYRQIGIQFGFDSWNWDSRDFICISHLFTDPMYLVSYVVSNDLALQIYQRELAEPGAGLDLYEKCLLSEDSYLLNFAAQYGLDSPFREGQAKKVAAIFKDALSS